MRPFVLATSVVFAVAALACGGNPPPEAAAPHGSTQVSSGAPIAAPAQPITSIRRSQVRTAIGQGVGAFLRNVTVEDYPAMKDGRFYGWRIRSVNPEWGLDVRPGDVVTRVNGMAIERPDDADAALRSLDKATALRVDYERDGKPLKIELPITED